MLCITSAIVYIMTRSYVIIILMNDNDNDSITPRVIGQWHTGDGFNWFSTFGVDKRISSLGFFCVYKTRAVFGSIVGKVANLRLLSQCHAQRHGTEFSVWHQSTSL